MAERNKSSSKSSGSKARKSRALGRIRVDLAPAMNVIICLRDIAENPVTRDGKKTTPISYDSNCLEEVCGSCAMLINGKARMACSALVDQLEQPIRIEPMSKFPVVRDLAVDRQFMFESLKRVKAWIPDRRHLRSRRRPRLSPEAQEKAYQLSTCISCGNCLEVCPQVNEHRNFVGAAIISQVRLFNMHPTGAMHAKERLQALMGPAACMIARTRKIASKACPKEIPLTESIAEVNRAGVETSHARLADRVESHHFSQSD